MDPKIWGPHAWFFMHAITLAYPDKPNKNDKDNIKGFFNYLGKVIPCHKCRNNFKNHLDKVPLNDKVLSSRENLVKWLIEIHNEVNEMTGKPRLDYKTAMENFINETRKNDSIFNDKFNLFIIIFMLLILVILIIIFMKIGR